MVEEVEGMGGTRLGLTQQGVSAQMVRLSRLLAMSHTALSTFLLGEVEQNPLLEYTDEDGSVLSLSRSLEMRRVLWGGGVFGSSRGLLSGYVEDEGMARIDQEAVQPYSLYEHLLRQVETDLHTVQEREIALLLIDSLDEVGYLEVDLETLSRRTGYMRESLEGVLLKVQGFDPAGIFARSLRECLALQLRDRHYDDPRLWILLDHLPDLARGRFSFLCKRCGVDRMGLDVLIRIIRSLNPKPALFFGDEDVIKEAIPDLFLSRGDCGVLSVGINTETLPCLSLNRRYVGLLRGGGVCSGDEEYLRRKWGEARWLLRALRYRTRMLVVVAQEIVRRQEGFVREGVRGLRPLSLRDIACVVGVHQSTISRIIHEKWIRMLDGRVIGLSKFFALALDRSLRLYASHSVCFYIERLIKEERSDNILSDSQLVVLLRERGIEITRRRVSRYRQKLGIPAAMYRRGLKGL